MQNISLSCPNVKHQESKIMGVCLEQECQKCVLLCFECTKDHKDHNYVQMDTFIKMVQETKDLEELELFKTAMINLIDEQIKHKKYIQQKILNPQSLNRKELIDLVHQYQLNKNSSIRSILKNQWILIQEQMDLSRSLQFIEDSSELTTRCSLVDNNQNHLNQLMYILKDYKQNIQIELTQAEKDDKGIITGNPFGYVHFGGPIKDIKQDMIYLKVVIEKVSQQLLIGLFADKNIMYAMDDKLKIHQNQKLDSEQQSSSPTKSQIESPMQTQQQKILSFAPYTVITVVFNRIDRTIQYNFSDKTETIILKNIDYSIPKLEIICCLKKASIRVES